ncbi:MAG: glutathione S-transferase domain-containing protein [Chitinophagales bacterium]|nr:glutathione S-transferase domain-containing protein [Hyphomicrobiales bacterium]
MFRVAFGPVADKLPPELVADRARLYLGSHGDLAKEPADLPHTLAQLRAQLGWVEERLSSGRQYLLGEEPGMPDLLVWYLVWFFRARYAKAAAFLAEFPFINAWADRMIAIGHGSSSPMTPAEALAVAGATETETLEISDPLDPQGLKPGIAASVTPITDSGEKPVTGTVRALGRDVIALLREHPHCGRVVVHFPRVGYRVSIL